MTRAQQHPDDRPDTASLPFIEEWRTLEGEEMPDDQDAVLDTDEIEAPRHVTPREADDLELDGSTDAGSIPDPRSLLATAGLAALDLREGETADPQAAAEDGIPWVPPIDPPVVPDPDTGETDPLFAAGTWLSATDQTYDTSGTLLSDEDDLPERVREALRADAETSRLADTLVIGIVGSTAVIRGVVDDIDDSDSIVAVAERVPGIDEVRDETEVPGL